MTHRLYLWGLSTSLCIGCGVSMEHIRAKAVPTDRFPEVWAPQPHPALEKADLASESAQQPRENSEEARNTAPKEQTPSRGEPQAPRSTQAPPPGYPTTIPSPRPEPDTPKDTRAACDCYDDCEKTQTICANACRKNTTEAAAQQCIRDRCAAGLVSCKAQCGACANPGGTRDDE